uniref:DUF6668 family protein n=1 Tax=Amycolatopsis sp. CA-151526 TaxID=3239921 RepID=UPI003F4907C5
MAFRSRSASPSGLTISVGPQIKRAPGSIEPPPQHLRMHWHRTPPGPPAPGEPPPRWWWLGCHGGAGATTLTRLIPGGWDAQRAWPDPRFGGPAGCFLVCRSNEAGLAAAQNALVQWRAGYTPQTLTVWGLVVMADAPGRLPRPLKAMVDRLAGVVQRTYRVPWVEAWRTVAPDLTNAPPEIARIGRDLGSPHWLAQPYPKGK